MTAPKVTLLNDTSSFHHHGSDLVVGQIRTQCDRHGLKLWQTVKLGEDWRADRHRWKLESSDIVIVNGEGTFHHDRGAALKLAQSAVFCHNRNIPCFLINSVYQANDPEMAHVVQHFAHVFVRESLSQAELRAVGIESDVVPDVTFSHADLPQSERSGVLVTDSSSPKAAAKLNAFYERTDGAEMASLFKPFLVPRALRKLAVRMLKKRTPKFWRLEQKQMEKAHDLPFQGAPLDRLDVLIKRISGANLIVTGRFHMVCLAMLAHTPFIALEGNSHKIEGMLLDAKLSARYLTSPPDEDTLIALSKWREGEVATVDTYLGDARARISNMFARIRQAKA